MTIRSTTRKAAYVAALPLLMAGCEANEPAAPEPPTELSEGDTFEGGIDDAVEEPLFRGVGQEPGWIVRIFPNEIIYDADYGERTVTVATPEPVETEDGRRYETPQLIVEIVDQPCSDSMSGAGYSATVTIIEDEHTRQGCGGDQTSGPDEGV